MPECNGVSYKTKKGDTIVSVARKFNVKLADLIIANPHLHNPTRLEPGEELCIPRDGESKWSKHAVDMDYGVWLPKGYVIGKYAEGLTFPTGIAFNDTGEMFVAESGYKAGSVSGPARILRVYPDGSTRELVTGFLPPVTGITWYMGHFYVSESGYPGQVTRVAMDGSRKTLIRRLPTGGDHQLSEMVFGPDGKMYFGIGTATNSGVVGPDNTWLAKRPKFHDIPCRRYELTGQNYVSSNPLTPEQGGTAVTGAFLPFGLPARPGQVVQNQFPCTGAVYQAEPDGTGVRVYADGLRNPFGLSFAPWGSLFATDNGMDIRGSRPVANAWDTLEEINFGEWYGWPDYNARIPVTDPWFKPPDGPQPEFLVINHPPLAAGPAAVFEPHSVAAKLDFSPGGDFGYRGEAFVPLFGHFHHMGETLPVPAGFKIVRVNAENGEVHDFMVILNRGQGTKGPVHPIQARFSYCGRKLYVVCFGHYGHTGSAAAGSGAVWVISRSEH